MVIGELVTLVLTSLQASQTTWCHDYQLPEQTLYSGTHYALDLGPEHVNNDFTLYYRVVSIRTWQ